jgi:hypothetical protein
MTMLRQGVALRRFSQLTQVHGGRQGLLSEPENADDRLRGAGDAGREVRWAPAS